MDITFSKYLLGEVTEQQVFDYVAKKLLDQNKQSRNEITRMCVYRNVDGSKCAVGHLIPDEEYNPNMDTTDNKETNTDVNYIFNTFYSNSLGLSAEDVENKLEFLGSLQQIHDYVVHTNFSEAFARNMRSYGRNRDLDVSVLD